ncbi:alpha/beta fold hydrolase [Pseudoalteromonas luteoviolacea]|uniref:alpha/beta hydrolase n=1 Tax=Pseudoalteromonas luteoviolacea TaxID=43657 RepID=UPI001B36642C|nr:alpha/beta hydrolase [Pseudoalteromonas luteoviolacea]MBQ4812569.1 alpha/beta fold hydrolase [Pseudoalteromonas luteoviolacea]
MNKYGKPLIKLIKSSLIPLAIACSGLTHAQQNSKVLQPCYVDGLEDRLMCGSISQPLSKDNSEESIEIHFAVIPAIKETNPTEAVLAFAGGPGQSAIEVAPIFARNLRYARENRDIILVDQRGTGKSNLLQCDTDNLEQQFALDDQAVPLFKLAKEETQACIKKLNTDLSNFTTVAAASDFEAVRIALGYETLHLYGASYGTRIAQEYMRQYPNSVATAVLDGVVPMQQSLVAIGDAIDDSLVALFKRCAEEHVCNGQYPNLEDKYQTLINTVKTSPIKVSVRHPRTFELIDLVITESKLRGSIRMALYGHTTRALVPLVIDAAHKGNYNPLVGLLGNENTFGAIAMGMHSAITCGEDWPNMTNQDRAKYKKSYFGRLMIEALDASCPLWQVKPVEQYFYQPLKTAIPTLLLSGGLDPATPPSWAELAMVNMGNAKHLVAPTATHGVAAQTCANKLIGEFINLRTFESLDSECLEKDNTKQYFMNINGPVASQSNEELQ